MYVSETYPKAYHCSVPDNIWSETHLQHNCTNKDLWLHEQLKDLQSPTTVN